MTELCGTTFLSVKVLLVSSPRQTWILLIPVIRTRMRRIFLHLTTVSERAWAWTLACGQTVSYAAERSMKTAPVFFFISKLASTWLVTASTCSVVFFCRRKPACSNGVCSSISGVILSRIIRSKQCCQMCYFSAKFSYFFDLVGG